MTLIFYKKSLVSQLGLCITLLMPFGPMARIKTPPPDEPVGITFFRGSWKEVLTEAKHQNKPVFLDVYTSWCPPCKRMAKEAFPNPKVGAKFNVHFINYQLDAEKGEGVTVAKQYAVTSYPTALYIAPNGDLIHRAVGYGGVSAMIDQADHVLGIPRLKATIAKGDRDYADGRREPDFLKRYLKICKTLGRPTSDILDAYIDALPEQERTSTETITFVAGEIQSANAKAFDYLLKNRPSLLSSDLAKQSLAKIIYGTIYRVLAHDFKRAVATSDETLLDKVIANNERNTISANPFMARQEAQKQETANNYRLTFYKQTRNFDKYRAIAEPIAQNQLMSQSVDTLRKLDSVTALRMKNVMAFVPDSVKKMMNTTPMNDRLMSWKVAHALYEIADTYRELGTSAADWNPALVWAERSIALYRIPECESTYAYLLKKLGRTE